MLQIEVKQDREPQVVMRASAYHLRKTTNPTGIAILVKAEEMTDLVLICPGCWQSILDGQSEDCPCYVKKG